MFALLIGVIPSPEKSGHALPCVPTREQADGPESPDHRRRSTEGEVPGRPHVSLPARNCP
eukprot:7125431-Prymnesium_polylepis.1